MRCLQTFVTWSVVAVGVAGCSSKVSSGGSTGSGASSGSTGGASSSTGRATSGGTTSSRGTSGSNSSSGGGSTGGSTSDGGTGGTASGGGATGGITSGGAGSSGGGGVQHYVYVLPQNGKIDVYDLDNGFGLVKSVPIADLSVSGETVLGAIATAVSGMLYVSIGAQGGSPGHLVAYDLLNDTEVWSQTYSFDMDSAAISLDGLTVYQATGALTNPGRIWELIDATTGTATGTIDAALGNPDTTGYGSHDTIVSLDGTQLFMGPRHSSYLVVDDLATNARRFLGPTSSGIRPFTINGKATLAFINTYQLIGFYVADLTQVASGGAGGILFGGPITPPGFTAGSCGGSHGISLSPDETELYLVDGCYDQVHVFDATPLPGSAPTHTLDIPVSTLAGQEGWINHTRDGRYVLVGDSGDVIETATHTVVGNLPSLGGGQTGIFTEVDFQNGVPIFSPLSRSQGGYVP